MPIRLVVVLLGILLAGVSAVASAADIPIVNIDRAWLADPTNLAIAGFTSGPYRLGRPRTTYILYADVERPGSAFVVAAPNVTLDLNGHTVNYDTAPAPIVPNGGFEASRTDDPERPSHWDIAGTPNARLVPARLGFWGRRALRIENPTGSASLVSAPVTLTGLSSAGPSEFTATITPKIDGGDATVTLTVFDAGGTSLGHATVGPGESARGFAPLVTFTPPRTPAQVRLRIDIVPGTKQPTAVELDEAAVFRSRLFGVTATRGYGPVPAELRLVRGLTTAGSFTIRNGSITQGAGRSFRSHPLFLQSLPDARVEKVRALATGMDTDALSGDHADGIVVSGCTFDSRIERLSRRTVGFGAIHLNGVRGQVVVENNEVPGAPMYGIVLANADTSVLMASESFSTPGELPHGWRRSPGGASFRVGTPTRRPSSSSGSALIVEPGGQRANLAWPGTTATKSSWDTTVAAHVLATRQCESLLFCRGAKLDTAEPTYVAAGVTTAANGRLSLRLFKVVNGQEVPFTLARGASLPTTVSSPDEFSTGWFRVTLESFGPSLRVQVMRLDRTEYLKLRRDPSTGAVTTRWARGENDSWALMVTEADDVRGGMLVGLGSAAGASEPGVFDDFEVRRLDGQAVRISGNRIHHRAIVADGYGMLINGVSHCEVSGNVIQPENGRGLLIEGADPSNPTRDLSVHDNRIEAREGPCLEYPSTRLEAAALRVRSFDAPFRDLHFRNNVFLAETGPGRVWSAIGARLSLNNDMGQVARANVRFEGNQFRAIVSTAEAGFQATALSISDAGPGAGIEFHDDVLESNHRFLGLGDRTDSYESPIADVTMTNVTTRRPSRAPLDAEAPAIVVGEGSNLVERVRVLGGDLAKSRPRFAGSKPKKLEFGQLVTVRVLNSNGQPIPGAAVRIEAEDTGELTTGTTDAAGKALLSVITTRWRHIEGTPGTTTSVKLGPFRLSVNAGGRGRATRTEATLDVDQTVTIDD
jgi:Macroglobulin domain MG4